MKNYHFLGACILGLFSCKENYHHINPSSFNLEVYSRSDIETPKDLIEEFYDYPDSEGEISITIQTKQIDSKKYQITLVHDHMHKTSQRATKIIMLARKKQEHWIVEDIKSNRKCYQGKGHSNWDAKSCYTPPPQKSKE